MSVQITKISDNEYLVNDKRIYKDSDDCWISNEELTFPEAAVFRKHILSFPSKIIMKVWNESLPAPSVYVRKISDAQLMELFLELEKELENRQMVSRRVYHLEFLIPPHTGQTLQK